jgi:glutathione reductase (NADPH)
VDFDLFVIGGGSAGVRCARIAAGHGARVGIAEERFWGGTCVNIGCVPKKFMVMAAEYGAAAEDARGFGWDIAKGAHDWGALMAAKDQEIERLNGIYKRLLDQAGAKIFEAKARFIDAHTLDVGGSGSPPSGSSSPPAATRPGRIFQARSWVVSDDAFYLKTMPRRVAIIGGGYIGVEFAGIFAGLGAETHLIYRQPLPLRGFDEDMRLGLAEAMNENGILLHPDTVPKSITEENGVKRLALSDLSVLDVDLVFFATGRAAERVEPQPGSGGRGDGQGRRNHGRCRARDLGPAYLRHRRRDRPAEPDPGGNRRGPCLADTLFGGKPRTVSLENVPTAVFSIPPIGTVGLTRSGSRQTGPGENFPHPLHPDAPQPFRA